MPVVMDGSAIEHPCHGKQSLDRPSKIDYKDADGKGCNNMSEVSTVETMPTLSDWPRLSDNPATSDLDDGNGWDDKDHALDDTDDKGEIDAYEHFFASERSSDEGRRCDISYSDCHEDLRNELFHSGLNDHLLSELHPETMVPKTTFSFPQGLHPNDELGKVRKPFWEFSTCSSVEKKENTVSFCNRRLKRNKKKHDGEEDLEVKFLAKVSILTQIAQHADQAQDLFTASSKCFGRQVSAGPYFSRQNCAPDNDLDFAHCFGRQVTGPLQSHCKSPASRHGPVDPVVHDDAADMDKESPGRAWWKMSYHVDQPRDSFMPDSKDFARQVSVGIRFLHQVSASVDDLKFDHGFRRQVSALLPSRSGVLTLKHEPDDLAALDEAVEIEAFAGPAGRALRNMAKHADQTCDPFMPDSKAFGRQVSAGPRFGRQVSAPADDLDFAHGFRRQVTAPLPSHDRSLTLKHLPTDLVVLDEAVEMGKVAGPSGRALQKMAQHADQTRDAFMPDSKAFGRQVSADPRFGRQVSAPADDLNLVHGFRRQVTAPLPSQDRSLTLKHLPTDLDEIAGPSGSALQKMAQHADQTRDPFMPDSKAFGRQVSADPRFGREVSAPADDLNLVHGFRRQVKSPHHCHRILNR